MPIFRNKRAFAAARLRDLGLLGLVERLARRPGLVVLCYHRVGDPSSDPHYDPLISATPEVFREHVRLLRDRFRLARLEDLPFEGDSLRPDEPTALITFDDGYRDNLDLALPILRDLGAPATFFLTTGFVGEGRLPWWDHVALVVKSSPRTRLVLDRPEPLEVDLGAREAALAAVVAAFLRAGRPEDPEVLSHLEERAGCRPPGDAGRRLFLTWDDARTLADSGMSIGAHTVSHRRLAGLGEAEQAEELEASKRVIERQLSREVAALAYPYGVGGAFDATTRRLAREAGYRLGFALRPGIIRPGRVDRLDLPRFHVAGAEPTELLRARLALEGAFGRSPL